jgi:hypothetical protein
VGGKWVESGWKEQCLTSYGLFVVFVATRRELGFFLRSDSVERELRVMWHLYL